MSVNLVRNSALATSTRRNSALRFFTMHNRENFLFEWSALNQRICARKVDGRRELDTSENFFY